MLLNEFFPYVWIVMGFVHDLFFIENVRQSTSDGEMRTKGWQELYTEKKLGGGTDRREGLLVFADGHIAFHQHAQSSVYLTWKNVVYSSQKQAAAPASASYLAFLSPGTEDSWEWAL